MDRQKKAVSFGKWILAGEHTLLRGGEALVFPLKHYCLKMECHPENQNLKNLSQTGESLTRPLDSYSSQVIEKALSWIGKKADPHRFSVQNTIPVSVGLGSSAAFCVSLSKLFFQMGWIQEHEILNLSLRLEHEFHGQSSGVDVQAVYHNIPLLFRKFDDVEIFRPRWTPYFYLWDTKVRSSTRLCVQKVSEFVRHHPVQGKQTDQKMKESVSLCQSALLKENSTQGLPLLKEGMNHAFECFIKWGLCEGRMLKIAEKLKQKGATVKPTGSGGGGVLLVLWDRPIAPSDPDFSKWLKAF